MYFITVYGIIIKSPRLSHSGGEEISGDQWHLFVLSFCHNLSENALLDKYFSINNSQRLKALYDIPGFPKKKERNMFDIL